MYDARTGTRQIWYPIAFSSNNAFYSNVFCLCINSILITEKGVQDPAYNDKKCTKALARFLSSLYSLTEVWYLAPTLDEFLTSVFSRLKNRANARITRAAVAAEPQ